MPFFFGYSEYRYVFSLNLYAGEKSIYLFSDICHNGEELVNLVLNALYWVGCKEFSLLFLTVYTAEEAFNLYFTR